MIERAVSIWSLKIRVKPINTLVSHLRKNSNYENNENYLEHLYRISKYNLISLSRMCLLPIYSIIEPINTKYIINGDKIRKIKKWKIIFVLMRFLNLARYLYFSGCWLCSDWFMQLRPRVDVMILNSCQHLFRFVIILVENKRRSGDNLRFVFKIW